MSFFSHLSPLPPMPRCNFSAISLLPAYLIRFRLPFDVLLQKFDSICICDLLIGKQGLLVTVEKT
jgi:hypothetical protein